MKNGKLGLVRRVFRRRAMTPLGECPACGTTVRLDDDKTIIHGKIYHEACAVYKKRHRRMP